MPLYRAFDVLHGTPYGSEIVLGEGEGVADAVHAAGLPAVATVTGASTIPDAEQLGWLSAYRVALAPDNDQAGRDHMENVGRVLSTFNVPMRWIEPHTDDPPKHDLADCPADEIKRRVVEAVPWTPPTDDAGAEASSAQHDKPRMGPTPLLLSAADVTPTTVRWLWPGYIPLAKPSVLDGDPGLGKSTATLDIAARLTVGGPMPDGSCGDLIGPSNVLAVSAEDDASDTIVPRLMAAGADLDRVTILMGLEVRGRDEDGEESISERPWDLSFIGALADAITRVQAMLCIIDPWSAFVPAKVNSDRDADVRRLLAALARTAAETGCAILLVRHLTKSGGSNSLYRGGGSIGIIGAARAGLMVVRDPDDPSYRVLAPSKANLAVEPPALRWILEPSGDVARVRWEGKSEHTADELLAAAIERDSAARVGKGQSSPDAQDVLAAILSDGPKPFAGIVEEARPLGFNEKALWSARRKLNVAWKRFGFGRGSQVWWWLPDHEPPSIDFIGSIHSRAEDTEAMEGMRNLWLGDAAEDAP
jgi:hypothetical protein